MGEKARHGHDSRRVVCLGCALVQVSPQPSEEDLDAYYREGYREEYEAGTAITVTDSHGNRRKYEPGDEDYADALDATAELQAGRVRALDMPEGARVLEVGCGRGRVLASLEADGYDVTGIEPGESAAADAELRGHVFRGRWQDFTDGAFDLVCAFHVLEHVSDPLAFLAWCRDRLTPGGQVLFEVPDADKPNGPLEESFWQHVHLFDFTRHTLGALLVRAGFDGIEVVNAGPALLGTGTHGHAPAREYQPHDGPSGEAVALWLESYGERNRPLPVNEGALADAFLRGQDVEDLDGLRREWREERAEVVDIQQQWGDLRHALMIHAQHAERLGFSAFDVWTPDDQVNGQVWGEAYAWTRIAMLLKQLHESMVRAEVTYQGRRR